MSGTPSQIWSSSVSRAAFNIVSLGPSLVGLPLFLITIIFGGKRIASRGAVFLNFMVSVTLLGISFGLLALVGQQDEVKPSSRMLCMVQTALVDGALGMTPVSILALVIQLGFALYASGEKRKNLTPYLQHSLSIVLILLPYVPLVVFTLRDGMYFMQIAVASSPASMAYDVMNPAFYCKLSTPFISVWLITLPVDRSFQRDALGIVYRDRVMHHAIYRESVPCTLLQAINLTKRTTVAIGVMIWRQCRPLRPLQRGREEADIPMNSLIRLTLFTLYRIAIFVVAIDVVRDPRIFPIAEFFHGAIPMVVFLIFGLQRDILAVWKDWLSTALRSVRLRGGTISQNPPIKGGSWDIV